MEINKNKAMASKHYIFGMMFEKKGETEKAIEEYEQAKNLDSSNVGVLKSLGTLYFNLGQIDKALLTFTRLSSVDSLNSEVFNFLGSCYYEIGLLEKALKEYERALFLNKKDAFIYNNVGVVYFELQKYDRAEEYYKIAIKIDSHKAIFHSNLGVVYNHNEMLKEAVAEFEKALKIDPNEVTAHYCLGMEYQHKGEVKIGSVVKIGQILKIAPPQQLTLKDYSRVYATRIEDIDEDTITIGAPIEKGSVIPLRKGLKLILGVPKDDALYGFYAEVVERKPGYIPLIVLKKASLSRRIQRRKYVRISSAVSSEVKVLYLPSIAGEQKNKLVPPFKITKNDLKEKNISAGGMLMVCEKEIPKGTMLKIVLNLPDGVLETRAEVVRVTKDKERAEFEVGTKFLNIDEKEKNRLLKYIYKRQVELKRLGW